MWFHSSQSLWNALSSFDKFFDMEKMGAQQKNPSQLQLAVFLLFTVFCLYVAAFSCTALQINFCYKAFKIKYNSTSTINCSP